MPFIWTPKDPDEIYEYEHDWVARLLVNGVDVGDAMLTSANPDPLKVPKAELIEGDVVLDAIISANGSAKIQYWLSGGTIKSKLILTIWTAQGRKYQESVTIPIKSR